ncbi:MAG TPA: GYDIA family GHMP kinase [Lentimicrobium sp.]|nr:GYDIA family GHMP kinase [Lentimicrobium sp.]
MEKEEYSDETLNFKANGKLLLTGEYLVIDGALALAFPISLGQTLVAQSGNDNILHWNASDSTGKWFESDFSLDHFEVLTSTDSEISNGLKSLFSKAEELNPEHKIRTGITVRTHLNYNRLLGAGSSSTLISLVAALFQADKYKLHKKVSIGSGYDVACTDFDHPIIFQRRSADEACIRPVNFMPSYADCLWFAYLGNKQDTNTEIIKYSNEGKVSLTKEIKEITDITLKLAETKDLTTFVSLIDLHEEIMGGVLKRKSIKEERFNDFNGSIKSLGAWGGDFILMATGKGERYISNYLKAHNIDIIFRFKDLVLNNPVSGNDEIIIRF